MDFKLLHALMQSPAFLDEMAALLAEEKKKALESMRPYVHAGDMLGANRLEGHIMALEDWPSVLRSYAERYQVEVGQPV